MREIEIKVKVNNYEEVISLLANKGWNPSPAIRQQDIIFVDKEISFSDIRSGTPVTRIRIQDDKDFILNVKVPQSSELDCIEHETKVENIKETLNILSLLGLHEVMRVTKVRQLGTIGNHTVCLDTVENLGCFIEFEILFSEEVTNLDKMKCDIWQEIASLGITHNDEVLYGYDTLLYKKSISSITL